MKKYVLGLAGFMGSGKTTTGNILRQMGADFIDADEVVDELYQPGAPGYKKIRHFFGDEYVTKNGLLNRKKLAKTVFNDPKKLRILQTLIHPLIAAEVQKIIDRSENSFVALEAILFEEKYLKRFVSAILWLECPKELLYFRLKKEHSMGRETFEKILRFQKKPEKVDFVIKNDGTKAQLRTALKAIRNC